MENSSGKFVIFELVKFKNINEFPFNKYPALSEYCVELSNRLLDLESKPQIKGIISLFPTKIQEKTVDVMHFYSFSTNRTSYAALKLLEEYFVDFYLNTEILPIIKPLHYKYIEQYKKLPFGVVRKIQNRGALLYVT